MKKYILLLIALALPLSVKAKTFDASDTFDVGDSVSVALYDGYEKENPNGIGFHVLKASGAGETTVTLIYDGIISEKIDDEIMSPTVYDELIPNDHDEVTTVFEKAVVGTKLSKLVNKEGAKWHSDSEMLLSESDLTNLGIEKNIAGIYEIKGKYSFLAPIKQDGWDQSLYNYWTMIGDEDTKTVYYVKYNENLTDKTDETAVWATIEPYTLSSITNGEEYGIRPVIIINKEYILCNNSKPSTDPTSDTSTPDGPKTGVEDYLIPLGVVLILASAAIVITKKKDAFSKI